ncbi:ATP-binding protein [Acidimangrovimonas sediminis]|uniref:ATP-binding protein n=1 Tax=Acidimangrovimonas sediminis TaxID=2056283 RepID=UPI0018EC21F0|nr:ATP-binding protein [Acidimangrovimonas sediminis]
MPFDILVLTCVGYVGFLFLVAFAVERRAAAGGIRWLRSPWVYTLSLSIYCTAWTFYGAVGSAARSGLEFVTIYLGPTIVFVGWWSLLRKLVRIGKTQRITSIADLISSRYGKSNALGVIVTLMAVVAATPYIALQLQSVTLSFGAIASAASGPAVGGGHVPAPAVTALWVAAGLAVFTVFFGTRNLDANEQHQGIVTAIAVEAVVKLVALMAIGIFVVWGVAQGPADILARIQASPLAEWHMRPGRWAGITFLSAAAVVTLPRMFQVLVVENADERHLATAAWAFPAYLFLMCLFVLPIAVVGLETLPEGANPDLFVLTLPLHLDRGWLAMLAFLGGFSSASAMVIVAAIALATMVSNHVVMPLWLWLRAGRATQSGDVRATVLAARRLSIAAVLGLGYAYYRFTGGGAALASIGLISFVGAAQVLPAMLGGIYWRGATRAGAAAGLILGFVVWLYTLFLPSFGSDALMAGDLIGGGPFGLSWLRPHALFGVSGMDPLLHALFWSLSFNTLAFCAGSLLTFPQPVERLQGAAFVNAFDQGGGTRGWARGMAEAEDLLVMSQRILGAEEAQAFFLAATRRQGKAGYLPDTTPDFLERLERRLAGSVGGATAHAMVAQIVGGAAVSVEDLMAVANETAQIMEYSSQIEAKSEELARTARALREANAKLTRLSVQKDAFLSQISHELRTPMTSIRSFSEILMEGGLDTGERARFAGVIHAEAIRLTRLLDDLLDLSVLENGQVGLSHEAVSLQSLIDRALVSAGFHGETRRDWVIERDRAAEAVEVTTDPDRLAQVFINLASNARKYCEAERPRLKIAVRKRGTSVEVDFVDNGAGIPRDAQGIIFEKFARLGDSARAGGAGLGLAICREIMGRLEGSIAYVPGQGGAAFRVTLPRRRARAA